MIALTLGDVAVWTVFLAGMLTGAVLFAIVVLVFGALGMNRDDER
jgi:hypothetical protein